MAAALLDITSYTKGIHPSHLYLKMATDIVTFRRIVGILLRINPDCFLITNAPQDLTSEQRSEWLKTHVAPTWVSTGIHYYGIRIFINEDMKRFGAYRWLLKRAMINKLSRI